MSEKDPDPWFPKDEDGVVVVGLDTQEDREAWIEALAQQDDKSLAENDTDWVKALVVHDGENMVARFIYPDGTEESFDLIIRRRAVLVEETDESERN